MAYQKPQAIIHQQFETIPSITEDELRAVIVGPSAILHRYADSDEKIDIFLGLYNPEDDVTYLYPGRSAGGIVDKSYSKLYVDNALLSYFKSTDSVTSGSEESIKRVVTGKSATTVYAKITQTGTGAEATYAITDTTTTAGADTKPTSGNYAVVLKYKRNADNLPLYKAGSNEVADPLDSNVDKYIAEDTTSFKHVFELATATGGGYIYIDKDDETKTTTSVAQAKTFSGTEDRVAYILGKDESVSKYQFYSKWDTENSVVSDTFNFKKSNQVRATELGIRDVKVGDYAVLWTTVPNTSGECVEAGPQLSRIIGFTEVTTNTAFETPVIDQPVSTTKTNTWTEYKNTTSSTTFTLAGHTSGNDPCVNSYKLGLRDPSNNTLGGTITVTVTDVVKSGNCAGTIYARVVCPSTGTDTTIQLKVGTIYLLTDLGTDSTAFLSFTEQQIAAIQDEFEAGTTIKWTYQFADAYAPIVAANVTVWDADGYIGASDTYTLEITEGLTPSTASTGPKATIYTALGAENSDVVLTTAVWGSTGIKFGTQGLKIKFVTATGSTFTTNDGLPAGVRISVKVKAPQVDRFNGILLADNVISDLRPTSSSTNKYINVRLLACEDVELPAISTYDGSVNYTQETSSLIVKENASMVSSEFINTNGTFIPLRLFGFGNYTDTEYSSFSKMYFNYREWSPVHATSCSLCETVSALDNIIGPLDVDNPLKWAVYKALTNSNGASVGYVAVKDPSDLDDWQDAVSILEGRTDVYTVVPLTTDLAVQNLVVTLVNAESAADACRWKTALFNMELPTEVMRIGASSSTQVKTSTDNAPVICNIVANPNLSGVHYNKVVCTSGNSKFMDYGVVPGDELRIMNGTAVYATYTVDEVYSNGTLTIMEEASTALSSLTIEIWHEYTRAEEVELIRDRAQSFASRRIGLVWPDIVAEGAIEMPGYYLSAALAGLKSGVEPQNGLTRRTIQGFDSFARSKPRYTESQLDLMAGSGVWVCVEDSDGTPQSRHALNTDTTNTFYSEEMMTRNFDSISKYMYQVIDAYIGTSNVTEETLLAIYYNIRKACDYLIGKGQMINYTTITVKQHDLLLDRIVAYLNVGLPFAVNNVELYITAEAYELNAVTLESEA